MRHSVLKVKQREGIIMTEKIALNLGEVQTTLLLPLWGRAIETLKKSPLLYDLAAVEILNKIDFDFTLINNNISEISQRGWVIRSLLIDKLIREFIQKYPNAIIVNIGCGLDTTFERIENNEIIWYDLDLPDVIELRKKLLHEKSNRKYIDISFLDYQWFERLDRKDNILFIAAGLLYYFEEQQVREFFIRIADSFPNSEMVLDATSPIGVRMANKMVIKNSGMDINSFLKWGLKKAQEIELWDNRIQVLEDQVFFKRMKKGMKLKNIVLAFLSDFLKMQYLIHLRMK